MLPEIRFICIRDEDNHLTCCLAEEYFRSIYIYHLNVFFFHQWILLVVFSKWCNCPPSSFSITVSILRSSLSFLPFPKLRDHVSFLPFHLSAVFELVQGPVEYFEGFSRIRPYEGNKKCEGAIGRILLGCLQLSSQAKENTTNKIQSLEICRAGSIIQDTKSLRRTETRFKHGHVVSRNIGR